MTKVFIDYDSLPNRKNGEEFCLRATFHNGVTYCYYGKFKKDCMRQLRERFGTLRGFVKISWSVE